MEYNNFDKEYYVMSIDHNSNGPLLAWGQSDFSYFLSNSPIDESVLPLPLPILFSKPYPQAMNITDLMMMGGLYVGSEKVRRLFQRLNIYGVQFIPVEITTDGLEKIHGYYAIHFWNVISAVDMKNYSGSTPNDSGRIEELSCFSLDESVLSTILPRRRPVFMLNENALFIIVHESIYETIVDEELTGFSFQRVMDYGTRDKSEGK